MKIIITEKQHDTIKESLIGSKVMVYFNLHKKTFSVKKNGVVVLYADYVKLSNVNFNVRQGGKEKVRLDKEKNVHAFVIGILEDFCEYKCVDNIEEPIGDIITYNPYKHDSFVYKIDDTPIYNADDVVLINSRNKIIKISDD